MDKILNYLSEAAKHLHIPIVIGGYLHLFTKKELLGKDEESNSSRCWGDNIPHFIFSDK